MTDFDSLVTEAQVAGVEARAERRRRQARPDGATSSVTVKDLVHSYLADRPEIPKPDLIRRVLADSGFDAPGLDSLSDEELMRVIATGNRVLAVRRKAVKK